MLFAAMSKVRWRAFVLFAGEPCHLQTWQEILYSLQTGKPSWDKVHGIPFFEYIGQHRQIGTIFDEAMTDLSHGETQAVASAYDFSHFRTLVDVGGGQGSLLTTVLEANPQLRGVLFDLPRIVEEARSHIASEGLKHRCDVVAGDLSRSVPRGGDAYILKYILHHFDDENSVAILKNCRQAMMEDARLLVVEAIVPPHGEPHFAKYQDLEMLVLVGGQERTLEEYSALFAQAQFKLVRVVPTQEYSSIIDAVPV